MIPDARRIPAERRLAAADRAKHSPDARLPELRYFNSAPCRDHRELTQGCKRCGIRLRRHQRVGAAWLYLVMQGLLADSVGLGKTGQVAAALAMCKETGELSLQHRAVVICRAAAVQQWAGELRRMLPSVLVITADGTPDERMRAYLGGWEICVISDRTLAPAGRAGSARSRDGDVERLRQLPVSIVVYDDIDAMRNGGTRSAYAVRRLAGTAQRVYGVHGTPGQKRLTELYHFLEPVGGGEVFGTLSRFRQRFVSRSRMYLWVRDRRDPTGRTRRRVTIWKDTGVKPNALPEFRRLMAPMVLRRTIRDLDDVELPAVQVNEVWLDLSAAQRARYAELQDGVLRRLRDTGTEVTRVEAGVMFTRGMQICSGLAALDDGRDDSVKLDWVVDHLTGDLAEDKVVCFVYFKPNVAALSARLEAEGIDHVLMWSEETDSRERQRRIDRFTDDPACRVLVGTTTVEQSLNLQAAGHLIAVDTILNPARMEQLVGRVRRQGSRHAMVVFHHLLARETQEDHYPAQLRAEQGMADAVWGETSDIFPQLTGRQILQMVAGDRR